MPKKFIVPLLNMEKALFEGVGEYGSCGMGEAAPCCTPRAISNAIYNAIGVRINETAVSPIKVLKALGKVGE